MPGLLSFNPLVSSHNEYIYTSRPELINSRKYSSNYGHYRLPPTLIATSSHVAQLLTDWLSLATNYYCFCITWYKLYKKHKDMSFSWTHRATKALLCLCEKEYWQDPLQEGKKDRISKSMKIMGYQVSPAQCQEKLDSLIDSFKQVWHTGEV